MVSAAPPSPATGQPPGNGRWRAGVLVGGRYKLVGQTIAALIVIAWWRLCAAIAGRRVVACAILAIPWIVAVIVDYTRGVLTNIPNYVN